MVSKVKNFFNDWYGLTILIIAGIMGWQFIILLGQGADIATLKEQNKQKDKVIEKTLETLPGIHNDLSVIHFEIQRLRDSDSLIKCDLFRHIKGVW